MDDLISRQRAIAVADSSDYVGLSVEDCKKVTDEVVKGLKQLPSAQPEREKGKWIVYYECPKCGEITKDFTEYCPFCNADMRGEEDE